MPSPHIPSSRSDHASRSDQATSSRSEQATRRPTSLAPFATSSAGGADHLRVDGVSRAYPDRRVLTDVSFVVPAGGRACLIGENGSGKSTLLRIVAGLDQPDAGTVTVPGTVGLFHQQPPFPLHLTLDQVLADATAPLRALARRVEEAGEAMARGDGAAGVRLEEALAEAEARQAWTAGHLVDRLVGGLGLDTLPRDRPAAAMSGGQLARLSLAWLLVRRPDTLLLDEPTNHLDDAATALLVELLAGWSGPVLIAGHDRAFLDDVATLLVDLDPAPVAYAAVRHDHDSPGSGFGVTRFSGSYTAYLAEREAARERWERRYRDEQAELDRLRRRVRDDHVVGHPGRGPRTEARGAKKFYADRNAAVVSRRVNDAAAALADLEAGQVRRPPAELRFRGLAGTASTRMRTPGPVLVATEVGLPGRLAPVSVALDTGSRLLVTGPNGCGKSTLLAMLAGELAPSTGTVHRLGRLSVGLLGQDVVPRDAERTIRDLYRDAVGADQADRTPLGRFGLIAGRDEERRWASLSVGQRRRLDLAILLAQPPDVLLLDEPTNHFSLLLATELERSLPDYPGAVVVASHDRRLRETWAGQRLSLDAAGPTS
ncbi:ABC-F family ATP-binding cassette domain-containing protein [Raineyella sp. LH-20]|uniref:ABC-F family ATP-binding cassette domain-containing protein n=1 Tax=Raineyella sp. LH-20 TaxID=3081204 RepID=UPI0029553E7B|nr:ABC-F family ATP-binding cassette domain-containing protein [Raineyella sp. LH-20]WOP19450.1 ABC-F family ATP-binding cassette domain-containing protein [Raineyella sp. LH-20]